jgi:ActR/RegA family two-component response regulator
MTPLLLISGEWPLRALLRAELLERGYDVTAVDSFDEAELLLLRRAVAPSRVVFDLARVDHPAAALETLRRLVGSGRVVTLTSAGALPAAEVRALGFAHVLARPFSVADVVAEAAKAGPDAVT